MIPIRTSTRVRHGIALALLGGILSTGCGSDPGSGDDPGSTSSSAKGDESKASQDACDMISDDVAAKVLGVKIVRREPHGEPGGPSVSCIKGLERSDDPTGYSYVNASVIAGGTAAADQAAGQKGSKPIAGLGDRAVFLSNAGALFVIDGPDLVQVQVVKAGVPGNQQQCVTLAKDVLSNLG